MDAAQLLSATQVCAAADSMAMHTVIRGEVMVAHHLAGWCLSGYTAILPERLRGGTGLLDSALVTCSLQKKCSHPQCTEALTWGCGA
jgi:hypothetical protein